MTIDLNGIRGVIPMPGSGPMFRTPDASTPAVGDATRSHPVSTGFDALADREKAAKHVWLSLISEAHSVGWPKKLDGVEGFNVEISLQRVVRDLWADTVPTRQIHTLYGSVRTVLLNNGRIVRIGPPEKKAKASVWWVCADWDSNHVHVPGKGLAKIANPATGPAVDERSEACVSLPPAPPPGSSVDGSARSSSVNVEIDAMRGVADALAPVDDSAVARRVLAWAATVFTK